mmetsp:Transcript_54825/g.128243  ORF Transcript_54825/g.128243 Transcript_54825/m.128243 type:complete len:355 (-) Transcript_54825:108-1172(-)
MATWQPPTLEDTVHQRNACRSLIASRRLPPLQRFDLDFDAEVLTNLSLRRSSSCPCFFHGSCAMASGEDVDAAIALSDPALDQVSRMRAEGISAAGCAHTPRSEVVPAHGAEGTADMQANTAIPSFGVHNANTPFHAPVNIDQPPAAVGTSLGEDAATVREPSHMPMPLAAGPTHLAEPLPERTHKGADHVERRAARLLARTFRANNLTTLQCFGLDEHAALANLVLALNAEGLRGHYNYVSIPRSMHGVAEGYAFINFTSSESCAWLVERWGGLEGDAWWFPGRATFKPAMRQGYESYVTEKKLCTYGRIRNRAIWPLIMTPDASRVVLGSRAARFAAVTPFSRCHSRNACQV